MMDAIPAVVRIFFVFGLILVGIRCRLSLGNAFVTGALVLGLVFAMPLPAVLVSVGRTLTDPKTLTLSAVVSLILVLSHSLERSGQMARMLDRFQGLVASRRLNIVIFPALIGLLPMPGGAIFSAPMVKTIGRRSGLAAPELSFINYWFRHLWEYCWPLYPGVLLATAVARLDLWRFVFTLCPLTIVAALIGYLPLRRMIPAAPRPPVPGSRRGARLGPFVLELAPVLIVIGPGIAAGGLLDAMLTGPAASVSKELGLIVALGFAIVCVWRVNRMPRGDVREMILRRDLLSMVYMVVAILVFKGVLLDSRAVDAVSVELMRWQVPLVAVTLLLPFIVGFVVGITVAFVGAAFPILISLIASQGLGDQTTAYMMLAMTGGFAGVLLSPLHPCLLLSNTYFGTSLGPVYRHLLGPCLLVVAAGLAYFYLLAG